MGTRNTPIYSKTLAGVLATQTYGILLDADKRTQKESTPQVASRSWLERLDKWFWKQGIRRRSVPRGSVDIFDLEQRGGSTRSKASGH
jgi:hypothetical protein